MAIDKVKKITLVVPVSSLDALQERLYDLSLMHVIDACDQLGEDETLFSRPAVDAQSIERRIGDLSYIESVCQAFVPKHQSLVEGFAPLPVPITRDEMAEHLSWQGLETLLKETRKLEERHNSQANRIAEIEAQVRDLSVFTNLPFDVRSLDKFRRFRAFIGRMPLEQWRKMMQAGDTEDLLLAELVRQEGKQALIVAASREELSTETLTHLRHHGFLELQAPALDAPVAETIERLEAEKADLEGEVKVSTEAIKNLAKRERPRIHILLGYWESEHAKMVARNRMAISKRVGLLTGYVRARDMAKLTAVLDKEFPHLDMVEQPFEPGEKIPVSLTMHAVFQPGELLINMFGVPDYHAFDPTPFVTGVYVMMFGICFGDTIYGIGLMALCWWLRKKYRDYRTVRGFFQLFFYCGITTTLVGFFTGSWLGDIYKYMWPDNFLLRLVQWMDAHGVLLDLLKSPMVGLLLALAFGVLNQFYGILLRMYRDARQNKWADAILDGGTWLVVLPGLLILASKIFVPTPPAVFAVGKWMFLVGAVVLILSQGRGEKGLIGKAINGVVSIYGILGTYGCSAFVGDMLSYSRLLALGLTTSIVAMSFNIIAGVLKEMIPVVGIVLFVVFLIFGHIFNFFVSILSAFVHSARLLFLEMFSRFYEPGTERFSPLGFSSKRVQIVEGNKSP